MLDQISNIFRLGVKELLGVRSDMILVLLIVYSFTYSVYGPARNSAGELANASVGIVDEDHSEASRRIRDSLRKPFVSSPREISVSEIDPAMDSGRFTFVLDIPPNFERDLTKGRWTPMQLNVDATAVSQVTTGVRYIQYVTAREVNELRGGRQGAGSEPGRSSQIQREPGRLPLRGDCSDHQQYHPRRDVPDRSSSHSRARARHARAPVGAAWGRPRSCSPKSGPTG
jgi:ABC-2 type transport system permease protein